MTLSHKTITIPDARPIYPLAGGVYGPIETPYRERLSNISLLVFGGYNVVEHVNGKKIKLTVSNFDTDFTKVEKEPVVEAPKQTEAPKETTQVPPVADTKEPEITVVPGSETPKQEETKAPVNNSNNQNNNKKNKNKQYQSDVTSKK